MNCLHIYLITYRIRNEKKKENMKNMTIPSRAHTNSKKKKGKTFVLVCSQ